MTTLHLLYQYFNCLRTEKTIVCEKRNNISFQPRTGETLFPDRSEKDDR